MFGTYRYLLAVMVMVAHLAPFHMVHTGLYAVFGFFTLSGYLMAKVLSERYLLLERGTTKYFINRALRIMPAYWAALFFSAVAVYYYPDLSLRIHERMAWPPTPAEWLPNIFVLGLTEINGIRSHYNLVPPSWSLGVEIVFWGLMPWIALSRRALIIWGAISIAYALLMIFADGPLQLRYYSMPAASLPFFLGALINAIVKHKTAAAKVWWLVPVLLVSLVYYLAAPWVFNDSSYFGEGWSEARPVFAGLYIAVALNTLCVFLLSRIDGAPAWLWRVDKFLGDLSYPIFLLHVLAGVVVARLFDPTCIANLCGRSWELLFFALIAVNIMAWALWLLVERPIAKIRDRFKA